MPDRPVEAAARRPRTRARGAGAIFAAVAAEGRGVLTEPEAQGGARAPTAFRCPSCAWRESAARGARDAAAMLAGGRQAWWSSSCRATSAAQVRGRRRRARRRTAPSRRAAAAQAIAARCAQRRPRRRVDGFAVQPMVRRRRWPGADPRHRPRSGLRPGDPLRRRRRGGRAPARTPPSRCRRSTPGSPADLVERTRVGRLLAGFRGRAPADSRRCSAALIALSHMVEDFPCLRAVDINPLRRRRRRRARARRAHRDRSGGPRPAAAQPRPRDPALSGRLAADDVGAAGAAIELRPIRPADALLYPRLPRADRRPRTSDCASWRRAGTSPTSWRCG